MSESSLTNRFLELRDPIDSIALKTELTSLLGRETVSLVWDYYAGMAFKDDGKTDYTRAYNETYDHIDGSIIMFEKYADDYHLNKQEHHDALCAWILEGHLIEDFTDLSDALMDTPVPEMLYKLDAADNRYPFFDDASNAAESVLFHLRMLSLIQMLQGDYKMNGIHYFAENGQEEDRSYAVNISNIEPSFETKLTREIQDDAAALFEILKLTRTKPSLRLV